MRRLALLSGVVLIAVGLGALAWGVAAGSGDREPERAVALLDARAERQSSRTGAAPRATTPPTAPVKHRPREAASCSSRVHQPLRTGALAYAAVVRTRAHAHVRPGGKVLESFGPLNVNGVPTVFGVLGRTQCRGDWLRVQLPRRPNGLLGWVRARDVELVRVHTRIEVDLSARRVILYRGGRELIRARAVIGAAGTPTPTGRYYVNQRLRAPNPSGPFGPAAIGISAFSPVLTDWVQDGPIAIHGTNRPDLIGAAASYGCVRVRNDVLVRMFRLAAEGTPVVIRA